MQTKTLFSPHYLTHRLPQHPEWAEDPRPVLEKIRPLWARARQYGDSWNEAQTERGHLRVDPSARAFQARLEKEYRASLEKLLPLRHRLAATDRLIDLILYRLYGLTEEEVRVVEESLS